MFTRTLFMLDNSDGRVRSYASNNGVSVVSETVLFEPQTKASEIQIALSPVTDCSSNHFGVHSSLNVFMEVQSV